MAQQVEDRVGEQGAERIHAAVSAIIRVYTSLPDKVSQVHKTPSPSVFSSPDAFKHYSTLYISLYKAVIKPFIHFHSYYCNAGAKQDNLTIIQLTINGCSRMRCPWRHTLRSTKS